MNVEYKTKYLKYKKKYLYLKNLQIKGGASATPLRTSSHELPDAARRSPELSHVAIARMLYNRSNQSLISDIITDYYDRWGYKPTLSPEVSIERAVFFSLAHFEDYKSKQEVVIKELEDRLTKLKAIEEQFKHLDVLKLVAVVSNLEMEIARAGVERDTADKYIEHRTTHRQIYLSRTPEPTYYESIHLSFVITSHSPYTTYPLIPPPELSSPGRVTPLQSRLYVSPSRSPSRSPLQSRPSRSPSRYQPSPLQDDEQRRPPRMRVIDPVREARAKAPARKRR